MLKKKLADLFYSFPVQLLILHFSSNLLLICIWLILVLLFTGQVAEGLGFKFLFLTPEYLGKVNFLSFFMVGFTYGGFVITWNLTTYLLESYRFPFLATLSRPYARFSFNNALVPVLFGISYLFVSIHFQYYQEYWSIGRVCINAAGFVLGSLSLILASGLYFYFTNKDILTLFKIRPGDEDSVALVPGMEERMPYPFLRGSRESRYLRVKTYLNESFKPRLVRSVAHYDFEMLMRVFRQNHHNALFIQGFSLFILITLGYMADIPYFMIPAGASIFIMVSVLVALIGGLTYWFSRWRLFIIAFLLILINYITSRDLFNYRNKAYGMDYRPEAVSYDYASLEALCDSSNIEADKAHTLAILENWEKKNRRANGQKPVMAIVCVTGGGHRAALWAMQVVQQADSLLSGRFLPATTLITGSSGGMIGMSYLREIYYLNQTGAGLPPHTAPEYLDKAGRDLLNGIAFSMVSSDLLLPWATFETDGFQFRKDRGYLFEKQLNVNTDQVLDRRVAAYKDPEFRADIPLLFLTPSIINDGRRLIISPQPVSYMMTAPAGIQHRESLEIDAVDFGRLFSGHQAGQLHFTTALRMNATYPYVLPYVYLPTQPAIAVMDAGYRDNYGLMTASRFIHVFKDWINEHTEKLIVIQIRGRDKFNDLKKIDQGVIETIFNPFGVAGQITHFQEFEHDSNLAYLYDLLDPGKLQILHFTYRPSHQQQRASITFHLTEREKADIRDAIKLPDNQANMQKLQTWFHQ